MKNYTFLVCYNYLAIFQKKWQRPNRVPSLQLFCVIKKKLFERQFVSFQADVGKDVDGAASVYVAGFEPRVGIARELRRLFSDYNHTSWHEHLPGREFQTKCQMLWLVGDLQFACQTNVFHPCAQLCMWCSDTFFNPRF